MKVGIIVHSHTGNTLNVAQRLKEELEKAGHSANLMRVESVKEDTSQTKNIQLKTAPDVDGYDALIFGAPVWAFSISPVMGTYLAQIPSIKDKKVGCFITQHFPFAWMGGNRSLKQLNKACHEKGAVVFETGIINWSRKDREMRIVKLVERLRNSL